MCAAGYVTRSTYFPCSSCAAGYGPTPSDPYKCQPCSSLDWTTYDMYSSGPSCVCPPGQVYDTKTLKCGEDGGVISSSSFQWLPARQPGCLLLLLHASTTAGTSQRVAVSLKTGCHIGHLPAACPPGSSGPNCATCAAGYAQDRFGRIENNLTCTDCAAGYVSVLGGEPSSEVEWRPLLPLLSGNRTSQAGRIETSGAAPADSQPHTSRHGLSHACHNNSPHATSQCAN